jgi:hypothetical protein
MARRTPFRFARSSAKPRAPRTAARPADDGIEGMSDETLRVERVVYPAPIASGSRQIKARWTTTETGRGRASRDHRPDGSS